LLGKHLTAHLKFEYGLALTDLLGSRFEAAAARLRSMLVAHPRNSGAAYHLGVALARAGDRRGAEPAFRQALALSQKDPARQQRLKWALAALLFGERRWAESLTLLRELAPTDEFIVNEMPPQVYELMMRCYALMGDWEASERLAIGAGGRQTTLAAIILARRNMKGARMDAALSHLERYLAAGEGREAADRMLFERAKRVATPLALKTAAQRVKEGRYDEARDLLLRTLASVADQDGTADVRARLNEFVQALQERATYPQRVERLAAGYEAMPVESVLEKEDLEAVSIEIPIVLPPKSQRALDQIERPVFDAAQWRAGTYPELLLAFDS
jgi:tetratricopeptide (TPR) repeat protein